jgi:hypothetical protein
MSYGQFEKFTALLPAGNTVFKVELCAKDFMEFADMCREIGALRYRKVTRPRWLEFKCVLRWLWLRRPTIRWRSPLDSF